MQQRCSKNGKIDDILWKYTLQLHERLLLVLLFLLCSLYVLDVSTLTSGPFNPPPLLDNPPYHFPAVSMQLRLYSSSAGIATRFVRLGSAPPRRTFVDLKYVAYL